MNASYIGTSTICLRGRGGVCSHSVPSYLLIVHNNNGGTCIFFPFQNIYSSWENAYFVCCITFHDDSLRDPVTKGSFIIYLMGGPTTEISIREASLFRWGRHLPGGQIRFFDPRRGCTENFWRLEKARGQTFFNSWKRGRWFFLEWNGFFLKCLKHILSDIKLFWPHSVFGPKGGTTKHAMSQGGHLFFYLRLGADIYLLMSVRSSVAFCYEGFCSMSQRDASYVMLLTVLHL